MRVFGVIGWKDSGKTTLVERLITELTGRGLRVSTIKHAHHAFEIDHEGRDSHRHRMAGAAEVLVASRARWALMAELRGEEEPALPALLAKLSPCDLVLIEGYKGGRHPKVEAVRAETAKRPPIATDDGTVVLLATDAPLNIDRPQLSLDDVAGIADVALREAAPC